MKISNKVLLAVAVAAAPKVWRWARPRLEQRFAGRDGAKRSAPGEEPTPPIEKTPLTPEPGNPPLDPNPERPDPGHLDPEHAP